MPGSSRLPRRKTTAAILALVAVTSIWGATFVVVKRAIEEIPPFEFLAIRFTIATIALAIVFPRQVRGTDRPTLAAGLWIGLALGIGYAFQTVGLKFTTATNAGFVTGLFVVFTPPVAALILRRFPSRAGVGAVALAAAGLLLLTASPQLRPARGDALIMVTAVAFAFHIVLLGKFAPSHDIRSLAVLQLAVAAAAFAVIALIFERLVLPSTATVWSALILTSIGASAIGFLVQTWAQTILSPTTTAVTLTMEPVFAGVTGFVFLGERLSYRGWAGAALILCAMLLVDLRSPKPAEV